MNPIQARLATTEGREQIITELEHRIAHHKRYRSKLVEESLQLSSSNPRKSFLLERARQFAQNIENLESRLYELYAERAVQQSQ